MTQKSQISRRNFMKSVAAGAGAVSAPAVLTGCIGDDDDDKKDLTVFVFGHGVASGDPLSDRVIIWTRVTPDKNSGSVATAEWQVATDEAMRDVVKSGRVDTDASKDYTIKVDVTGLKPNTTYYYLFRGEGNSLSPVGKTKTLPVGDVSNVKLAVCSCANFPYGNFNVYKEIANSSADAVLHLGDYIYEYKSGVYPETPAEGRQLDPVEEIITLDQYRARYNQYRRDENLQLAHQSAPFICVWDDHELANDAFKDGAQNHDEDEGSFAERRAAAFQAYHEWLPIRSGADLTVIDRSFDFGNLLSLHMADTRHVARTKSLTYSEYGLAPVIEEGATEPTDQAKAAAAAEQKRFIADITADGRSLLGTEQQSRVIGRMFNSTATWQVLGQQVLMGRMSIPAEVLGALSLLVEELDKETPTPALVGAYQTAVKQALEGMVALKQSNPSDSRLQTVLPYNLDAWDGYPVAREEILQRVALMNKNLVVLAGDTHNAWASDLYPLDSNQLVDRSRSVGVEFATSSVTSPGFETYAGFGDDVMERAKFEGAITTLADDLKYLNASDRGFMLVTFSEEKASCEWRYVSTVSSSTYETEQINQARGKTLEVYPGASNRKLVEPAS